MNKIPIFEEIDLMLLRKSRSDNIKEAWGTITRVMYKNYRKAC